VQFTSVTLENTGQKTN